MSSCVAGSSTSLGRPIDIEGTYVTSGFVFNQFGCIPCTSGKFISDPQELACSDCEKGKSNINIGSSFAGDCVSCSVGTYEKEEGSSRPECLLCPSGKALNTVGATSHFECLACPGKNMFSAEGSSSCVCDKGYLMNGVTVGNGTKSAITFVETCVKCPEGSICDAPGSTLTSLVVAKDYWRPSNTSLAVIECDIKGYCLQGNTTSPPCALGHGGPVCGICTADYSMVEGTCQLCDGGMNENAVSLLGFVGFVLICTVLYHCSKRSRSDENENGYENENENGIEGMSSGIDIVKRQVFEKTNAVKRQVSEKANAFKTSNFASFLRQILVYFQILGSLEPALSVKFPTRFSGLTKWMSFFNLDIFGSFGCWKLNHYDKLLLFTVTPIVLELLLVVVYFALSKIPKYQTSRNVIMSVILSGNFLILPKVSMIKFSTFNCRTFEDRGTFLRSDYSLSCTDERYGFMRNYAYLMTFVYPLGIPVVNHFMLWRVKDKLNPPQDDVNGDDGNAIDNKNAKLVRALAKRETFKEIAYLSFLYSAYIPELWWFETFESFRRIALTGGLLFFEAGSPLQCVVGLLITIVCVRVYAVKKPFLTLSINRFGESVQWQIAFTFLVSMLLLFDADMVSGNTGLFDLLLVALTFFAPVVVLFGQTGYALRGAGEVYKLRHRLNQIAPNLEEDEVVENSSIGSSSGQPNALE